MADHDEFHAFAVCLLSASSFAASTVPVTMASPTPPVAGRPLDSMQAEMVKMPTIVFMKYGSDLESPWSRKELAKQKFIGKIAALQPELARTLVLIKVHIKENGYALNLFFEHVPDQLHSQLIEVVERWAGNGGHVRFLNEDEIARQVVADVHFKMKKRSQSDSLGNIDQISSIMSRCLELQGKPADGKDVAKAQRKISGLVVQCMDRAQAQQDKEVNKKPRAELQKPSSDSD